VQQALSGELPNRDTSGLRDFEIDDQLELGRLIDGQIGRLDASEDAGAKTFPVTTGVASL